MITRKSPGLPLQAAKLIERPVEIVGAQVEARRAAIFWVDVGRVEQLTARGKGRHAQRARSVLRAQGRALQRVNGDVDSGVEANRRPLPRVSPI